MGSVAVKNEQALLAICRIPCPGIEVALQLLCRKLFSVATVTIYRLYMRKHCSLVCIIVCIEPATVLVFALVSDDWLSR